MRFHSFIGIISVLAVFNMLFTRSVDFALILTVAILLLVSFDLKRRGP